MNAVLLCGSPRKNGNTEYLLNRCAERFEMANVKTHLIHCADVNVLPCKACGACRKLANGTCAITSDDFNEVFSRLCAADIIISGSPVYFGSATPNIMSILDRSGYVSRSNGNLFSRKIGGPLVVARRAGQNFTYAQLIFWYMINDMIVPGSSYWNISFGREPGEVSNDKEGVATIDRFAENIIWLAGKVISKQDETLVNGK
jgi:multimeric flavodoxin WrbA